MAHPASVHFGTADAIDDARRTTLTAAFHANPARFGKRPHPPTRPDTAWINWSVPAFVDSRLSRKRVYVPEP